MRNTSKTLLVIILAGMLALLASGCEKQSRYKVLTFFFTGVPPIDGAVGKKAGIDQAVKKKKKKANVLKSFVHGPKAAGECFYCHDTDTTLSFQRTKRGGGMPRMGDISPGRLAVPPRELCIQCHTSKSAELRFIQGFWVHGPLSDGACNACHDNHQTVNQYMLYKESSIDLCTECHANGYIMETKEHVAGDECILCHNPHVGANRLMLRKDFDEVF